MGKKYSILFDSFHLYHLPQFEPLIDLLADDERFRIYHSASRKIQHNEYDLCKSVLTKKPGEFIFADSEAERKEKIRNLFDRINELQQIIDLESDAANEGCISSQQLIINAEQEKEVIQEQIDALALWFAFA